MINVHGGGGGGGGGGDGDDDGILNIAFYQLKIKIRFVRTMKTFEKNLFIQFAVCFGNSFRILSYDKFKHFPKRVPHRTRFCVSSTNLHYLLVFFRLSSSCLLLLLRLPFNYMSCSIFSLNICFRMEFLSKT
jgi:hypothetical protein